MHKKQSSTLALLSFVFFVMSFVFTLHIVITLLIPPLNYKIWVDALLSALFGSLGAYLGMKLFVKKR